MKVIDFMKISHECVILNNQMLKIIYFMNFLSESVLKKQCLKLLIF